MMGTTMAWVVLGHIYYKFCVVTDSAWSHGLHGVSHVLQVIRVTLVTCVTWGCYMGHVCYVVVSHWSRLLQVMIGHVCYMGHVYCSL